MECRWSHMRDYMGLVVVRDDAHMVYTRTEDARARKWLVVPMHRWRALVDDVDVMEVARVRCWLWADGSRV
jgi:hypothetical protein